MAKATENKTDDTTDTTEATEATEATTEDAKVTTTKAQTFQDAAKDATPSDVGYLGVSPERERTGLEDKGLSQANPAVMKGGAIPDARRGVDDSKALKG